MVYSDISINQSEINMDLETLSAHLRGLVHNFRKGRIARNCQIITTCYEYRVAKSDARGHRMQGFMQDSRLIDLDSTSDWRLSRIGESLDSEQKAMDACYKAIAFIRSELKALDKIKQTCSQVLELVDGALEDDAMKAETLEAATKADAESKRLLHQLKQFR